jgi:hypothetical protein
MMRGHVMGWAIFDLRFPIFDFSQRRAGRAGEMF